MFESELVIGSGYCDTFLMCLLLSIGGVVSTAECFIFVYCNQCTHIILFLWWRYDVQSNVIGGVNHQSYYVVNL